MSAILALFGLGAALNRDPHEETIPALYYIAHEKGFLVFAHNGLEGGKLWTVTVCEGSALMAGSTERYVHTHRWRSYAMATALLNALRARRQRRDYEVMCHRLRLNPDWPTPPVRREWFR